MVIQVEPTEGEWEDLAWACLRHLCTPAPQWMFIHGKMGMKTVKKYFLM